MRIIQENVLAGVRLEFHINMSKKFVVITRDLVYCFHRIENALEEFDKTVNEALHTQTEKTMSPIDLENPPVSMMTTIGSSLLKIGSSVLKIGEIETLEFKYVLQIIDGDKNLIVFSNRDATKTCDSYRQSMEFSIQRVDTHKPGWINIYRDGTCSHYIHASEKEAVKHRISGKKHVDTIEITWEE